MLKLKKINFFYFLVIFLSIIGIVYTYYKAEIVYLGTQDSNYIKFYFVFGLIISIFFICLFFNDNIKQNIIQIFFSIFFSAYILETIVLSFDLQKMFDITNKINKPNTIDKRNRYEVAKDLNKKNTNEVKAYSMNLRPHHFVVTDGIYDDDLKKKFQPINGISNSLIVNCLESEEWQIYKSDRFGFNNQDELWNDGNVDVVLIGDSFVEGDCVKSEESLSGNISELTGNKIISLGIGGSGPLFYLARIREYANRLKPKKIIWFHYEGNDITNLYYEKQSSILLNYLSNDFSQKLIEKQNLIDKNFKNFLEKHEKLIDKENIILKFLKLQSLRNFLRKAKLALFDERFRTLDEDKIDEIIALYEKILISAIKDINLYSGELHVVYLPSYARYLSKDYETKYEKIKKDFFNMLSKNKINFLDAGKVINIKDFPYIPYHYNKEGYKKVSNIIIKNIFNLN